MSWSIEDRSAIESEIILASLSRSRQDYGESLITFHQALRCRLAATRLVEVGIKLLVETGIDEALAVTTAREVVATCAVVESGTVGVRTTAKAVSD